MKKIITTVFLSLFIIGCTTAPETQTIYNRYVEQFNATNPSITHTLYRPDGFRIHAREFGVAYKDIRPTLVMMHGFPDNQHLYDPMISDLADTYHIVSFDFLGWGESEKPPQHLYDVASQRLDLETLVNQLNLNSLVLVTHDLSGQSGIDWALDNESSISALVLLNTYYSPMPTLKAPDAIEFYSASGLLRDLAVWGANKSARRFKSGLQKQISAFMSNPTNREIYVPVISNSAPAIRPAFFSSTSVLWAEIDTRRREIPRLQQFKKPVHIIFGADDPFLNIGVAREFDKLFENSSLYLINGASHYVQLDEAKKVGAILRTVLKPNPSL